MNSVTLEGPVVILPADEYQELLQRLTKLEGAVNRLTRLIEDIEDIKVMREAEAEYRTGAILALGSNPRPVGAIQLQKDIYRIRVGNYRVVYKVYDDEELVLIGRVVRRSEDTYRRIGDLFD